ncbi:hypothetical protein [Pelagibacterium sp.]|uniref:hypothetical protein n=1 Tax=Pelagibacterium sp. TaxID=1967288 RepID=UPI003A8D9059
MALANPLGADAFFDRFRLNNAQLVQGFQQQRSATAGGNAGYADRAVPLWQAQCVTVPMEHGEAEGLMALINSRAGGIKTVLLYNKKLPYPASDPDGSLVGSVVPEINVITDRLHVSFSGFPVGYQIPLGTYFGIVFDTSRYYLGQFLEARTANPITGAVASTEIWPPLPASISSGADIIIKKPCAKFRITPNSAAPSVVDTLHQTIQFTAEQTYGA